MLYEISRTVVTQLHFFGRQPDGRGPEAEGEAEPVRSVGTSGQCQTQESS